MAVLKGEGEDREIRWSICREKRHYDNTYKDFTYVMTLLIKTLLITTLLIMTLLIMTLLITNKSKIAYMFLVKSHS